MSRFLICIHDASPASARETQMMIRELAPLVGRRLSFGVVPDWHGEWPLAAHRDHCAFLKESSQELLLHGYAHRRRQGWGPVSWIASGCDEMNGLDQEETHRLLHRAQSAFADAFGAPAAGFLAPGWQAGQLRGEHARRVGLAYVLGFFAVAKVAGGRVPLATWTWDCGRWGWLGHVGHEVGRAMKLAGKRTVSLALHPKDLERGFWPGILLLVRRLLDGGHVPATPGELLRSAHAEVAS